MYRVNDDIVYHVDIEEHNGTHWRPYMGTDVQVQTHALAQSQLYFHLLCSLLRVVYPRTAYAVTARSLNSPCLTRVSASA